MPTNRRDEVLVDIPVRDRYADRYDGPEATGQLEGPISGAAEVIDYSETDWVPTIYIPRAVNCQVAGLVTVDLLNGSEGVQLWFVQGTNAYRVKKVYHTGTTPGLGLTAVGG